MKPALNEAAIESIALGYFESLGYTAAYGPSIAHDSSTPERGAYTEVILKRRLRDALQSLNPGMDGRVIDDAVRQIERLDSPDLIENNHRFHRMLVDGVKVERLPGEEGGSHHTVRLVDWDNPAANNWLAVNQYTVTGRSTRRPDIVVFVNGLPLSVIELKNPLTENADEQAAWNQIQTYQQEIPALFNYNTFSVISDGLNFARAGTITASLEWYKAWKTVEGDDYAPAGSVQLRTLIHGIFEQSRLLKLIRHFIVFNNDGKRVVKKLAGYHQFHAVLKAVERAVAAAAPGGDRKAGVIWHTQGSGKSLTMAFFAGLIAVHPALRNPTLVVLTDRNDLDDQLFDTFAQCSEVLGQEPKQATDRAHLRELLAVASGGVVFTTMQKFAPEEGRREQELLSARENIIFIADEAHRSHYGFKSKTQQTDTAVMVSTGFAKHLRDALPNASFIGFTGTPVTARDRNTYSVFGDVIDTYDIQQAVTDEATVPIYYEPRLVKLSLAQDDISWLDTEFDEIAAGADEPTQDSLKAKWARIEALVGNPERIRLVAADLVAHYEERETALNGKALVVCMSRRIASELYEAIRELRPEWHGETDTEGMMKVVMTGSAADAALLQPHVRTKQARKELAQRFRKPEDPLKLVIVCDMWLTGFDCPPLHTMYIDKLMRGHNLMQAIARVNRVFKEKQGGLVVDYIGFAEQLKEALKDYTVSDREITGVDIKLAVALLRERLGIVRDMYHGFDYGLFFTGTPEDRLRLLTRALDHVLGLDDGKRRYIKAVTELSTAFSLAAPHEDALRLRDEVAFFQAVKVSLLKRTGRGGKSKAELDAMVRQLVTKAIAADEVLDIYEAAGLMKPEMSILSEEWLEEVRRLPQRHLALEALKRLLNDEIKSRFKTNVVKLGAFSEKLEQAMLAYQNRALTSAEVMERLIEIAREVSTDYAKGEELGLTADELAFYDALATNESAVQAMGDETLAAIARALLNSVRGSVTIDWTAKESVKVTLRMKVRKLLRDFGYPPDLEELAVQTVLKQAEAAANELVG